MAINYDDERFTKVENEKQTELDKYNQTYDKLINERNDFTNQQQQLVDRWETTQKDIANQQLQHQTNLINQQKEKANEEYQKEAQASYIDYQKEVDKYGVSRENVVSNGLSNSGYAESSKVDMYNTYQNRLASARSSLKDAQLEFDNAIKEAQLTNNETLAQNALTALQNKLNIALEGFNYKTEQENNKLNWNYNINNTYYNRYQDVEDQINYENEVAEQIRQYNEQMAYKKEQDRIAQEQWEKQYALQQAELALSRQKAAQEQAYYASLIDGSPDESDNEQDSDDISDVVYNQKKSTPALSSNKANNWASSKIFTSNTAKNGISASELEKLLSEGLSNKNISNNDAKKILSWFGL